MDDCCISIDYNKGVYIYIYFSRDLKVKGFIRCSPVRTPILKEKYK